MTSKKSLYYSALLALLYLASCLMLMKYQGTDAGNWDNQSYAYAAYSLWHDGGAYKTAWLDKPPLAFIAYLPTLPLDPIRGMNAYFCIVISLVSYLLFRLLLRLKFQPFDAAIGAIALFESALWMTDVDWLSLSHLGNLVAIVSLLLFGLRSRNAYFLAGVVAASSFFIRQNSVLFILLPFCLFRAEGGRAPYTTGVVGGFVIWLALCYSISDSDLFLYTTFLYPYHYAHMSHIAADLPSIPQIAERFFYILLPVALAFAVLSVQSLRLRGLPFSPIRIAATLFLLFVICLLPGKPWLHYLAFMLLGLGIFYGWCAAVIRMSLPHVPYTWALGFTIVIACIAINAWKFIEEKDSGANRETVLHISSEIRQASHNLSAAPTAQIFCNGFSVPIGPILRISGARPANPLFHVIYYTSDFESVIPPAFKGGWQLLDENPPQILAYCPEHMKDMFQEDLRPKIEKLIHDKGYREFSTVDGVRILTRSQGRDREPS